MLTLIVADTLDGGQSVVEHDTWVLARNMAAQVAVRGKSRFSRHQLVSSPALSGHSLYSLRLHGFPQLLQAANLDLPHPLTGDAVMLRQPVECCRIILEPALGNDVALPMVQLGPGVRKQGLAPEAVPAAPQ